jgi:hypothetical protein
MIKKNVSFNETINIFYIPSRNENLHLKYLLWWTSNDLSLSYTDAVQELKFFSVRYSMTLQDTKRLLYQSNL